MLQCRGHGGLVDRNNVVILQHGQIDRVHIRHIGAQQQGRTHHGPICIMKLLLIQSQPSVCHIAVTNDQRIQIVPTSWAGEVIVEKYIGACRIIHMSPVCYWKSEASAMPNLDVGIAPPGIAHGFPLNAKWRLDLEIVGDLQKDRAPTEQQFIRPGPSMVDGAIVGGTGKTNVDEVELHIVDAPGREEFGPRKDEFVSARFGEIDSPLKIGKGRGHGFDRVAIGIALDNVGHMVTGALD